MKLYVLRRTQKLPVSKDEAWQFISNPANLATITPPSMGFTTLSGDERKMFPGQIIHYTITPLLGLRMQWVTEITHVDEGNYFVDEQRFGPYSFWHHKHFLREIPGGVLMEDIVHYALPLAILGEIAHHVFVGRQLEQIFEFRQKKIEELFGRLL
ncbi:MAG TPA: SRPBCC family protein [Flavobacterium sp.]|jgi:ligand-binding SRPBCC domain-containing protein